MTIDELKVLFDKHEEDEFLKFERVTPPDRLSNRPDLCGFLWLDKLVPGNCDIISGAEHDEIYLDGDLDQLAEVVTESIIITLIRCGVRRGEYGLEMFA